jgi:hypothetical protein
MYPLIIVVEAMHGIHAQPLLFALYLALYGVLPSFVVICTGLDLKTFTGRFQRSLFVCRFAGKAKT